MEFDKWLVAWLVNWLVISSVSQSERRSRTLFAFNTAVPSSCWKMKVFVLLPSYVQIIKEVVKKIILHSYYLITGVYFE